jgi:predicted XRE-type DNA-binding protein
MNEQFENVWEAIEDTPGEAAIMTLRSSLMIAARDHMDQTGMSKNQAAKAFGVTQQRISDLIRGEIDRFDTDGLVNMLGTAGLHIELRICAAEQVLAEHRATPNHQTL